jgi:hypothetical protein
MNSLSNNSNNKKNVVSNSKSNSGGKYKNLIGIIIAAVAFVIILYLLHKLRVTYQANRLPDATTVTLLKYVFDCKNNHKNIDNGLIPKSAIGNEYNLSFWIYINNLQHNYIDNKNVIVKGDILNHIDNTNIPPEHVNPRIYIPKKTHQMKFEFKLENYLDPSVGCYDRGGLATEFSESPSETDIDCKNKIDGGIDEYYALSEPSKVGNIVTAKCIGLSQGELDSFDKVDNNNCYNDMGTSASGTYEYGSDTHMYVQRTGISQEEDCKIDNLPLQKWNCISMNVHNNICDVFLNNKLEVSTEFKGSIKPNTFPMILGSIDNKGDSGFDGYLSNIQYTNHALPVGDINQYFKDGPKIMKDFKDSVKSMFGK